MHNSLMRPEPSKLYVVRKFAEGRAKVGHKLLDVTAVELRSKEFDRSTYEVISPAHG